MVGDELTRNWSRRHKAPARFGGRAAIANFGLAFGVWRRAQERIDESAFIAEDCRVVAAVAVAALSALSRAKFLPALWHRSFRQSNQSSRSGLEAHRTEDLKSHSPIYAASNTLMAKKARVKQRLRVWRCFFGVSPPALSANRHSKSGSAAERKSVHP